MSDDSNTTQDVLTLDSQSLQAETSVDTGPEAQNRPINADTPVVVKDDNSGVNESESTPEDGGIQAEKSPIEPVSAPDSTDSVPAPESRTGQIPVFGPFGPEQGKNSARSLWAKVLNAIQVRRRKKLERIMALFVVHPKLTNAEVWDLLHISKRTATRYLDILEQEGKIMQSGKTGHIVSYSKI